MRLDPHYAKVHKAIYNQLLDELDTDIIKEILAHPYGEEARVFNEKVDRAVKATLGIDS